MKTRTHFGHRIDMLDREGEIIEHLAGVEDSLGQGTHLPIHSACTRSCLIGKSRDDFETVLWTSTCMRCGSANAYPGPPQSLFSSKATC